MIVRGHRVYRGHQGGASRLPAVLLFLAVFLVLVLLAVFSLLPQYLVYHRNSVEMVVPMLEEDGQPYTVERISAPQPYSGEAVSTVQVTEPDYSDVDMTDLSGMNYLRGYYVALSKINENGLTAAVKDAERNNLQGLILQMKDESGKLAWVSDVPRASSSKANSEYDPSAYIAELKADGWYLAAEICCSVDTLLADSSPELALRDRTGAVYEGLAGKWVDPWNREVRSYTVDLCEDLLRMGFDEIILSRVEHPQGEVSYTRSVASGLSREACVMNFAASVRTSLQPSLKANGAHLCAVVTHDVFSPDGTANGQSLASFLKIFDRVVISTATYSDDVKWFLDQKEDSTLRFVPQMTWAFGGASVILDPAAPAE